MALFMKFHGSAEMVALATGISAAAQPKELLELQRSLDDRAVGSYGILWQMLVSFEEISLDAAAQPEGFLSLHKRPEALLECCSLGVVCAQLPRPSRGDGSQGGGDLPPLLP